MRNLDSVEIDRSSDGGEAMCVRVDWEDRRESYCSGSPSYRAYGSPAVERLVGFGHPEETNEQAPPVSSENL